MLPKVSTAQFASPSVIIVFTEQSRNATLTDNEMANLYRDSEYYG